MPGGREGAITSPPSYSVADANKFRTDQNSSPVPSTINQQVRADLIPNFTLKEARGISLFSLSFSENLMRFERLGFDEVFPNRVLRLVLLISLRREVLVCRPST